MADTKVSALTEVGTAVSTDAVYVVLDPTGSPLSRRIQLGNLKKALGVHPDLMSIFSETQADTTIGVAGTYVKAANVTTINNQTAEMTDDTGVSNRVKHTGAESRHFLVAGHIVFAPASGGANQELGVKIWHWDDSAGSGSYLPGAHVDTTIPSASVTGNAAFHGDVLLETDDYLEVHITNENNANDITVYSVYMVVSGVSV